MIHNKKTICIVSVFALSLVSIFIWVSKDHSDRYKVLTRQCEELYASYCSENDDRILLNHEEDIENIKDYFLTFGPVVPKFSINKYTAISSFLYGVMAEKNNKFPESLRSLRCTIYSADSTNSEWGYELICRAKLHEAIVFKKLQLNIIANEKFMQAVAYAQKLHTTIEGIDAKSVEEYCAIELVNGKEREEEFVNFYYNSLENEEYKSYADTTCIMIILLCAIWIVAAVGVLFFFFRQYKSKKKKIEDLLINISAIQKKEQELKLINQDSELFVNTLKEIKSNDVCSLKESIGHIELTREMIELSKKEERLINGKIVLEFHDMVKNTTSPRQEDWKNLKEFLQDNIPTFFPTINRNNNLREDEKNLCTLVRLHFLPSEMSILLNISKQAVTTNRKRLLYKIFKVKDCGAKEFDKRIILIT